MLALEMLLSWLLVEYFTIIIYSPAFSAIEVSD
jgi:hypothetical protein